MGNTGVEDNQIMITEVSYQLLLWRVYMSIINQQVYSACQSYPKYIPFHCRDIAEVTGLDYGAVAKAINDLVDVGMAELVLEVPGFYYQLRPQS